MSFGISRRRRIKNTADMRRHSRMRVGRYSIINLATLPPSIIVLSITDFNPYLNPPSKK